MNEEVCMPRPAVEREAAQPKSAKQVERYERILRVTRKLTIEKGEDAVQMVEVAEAAEVALNTLYRYFPSKTHLYAALLNAQMQSFANDYNARAVTTKEDAVANVIDLLGSAGEALLARPRLAKAVMNASVGSSATHGEANAGATAVFTKTLLHVMGIENPTEADRRIAYLLMVSWSGVLASIVNSKLPVEEFQPLLKLAVERLIGTPSTTGTGSPNK